mmetsp:Transcript_7745/g.18264  ORF Transcript_7745/g.18264 Transcript_7745/m.18264 type:complete len:180 (+) Transcript_7745:607-1146(+)
MDINYPYIFPEEILSQNKFLSQNSIVSIEPIKHIPKIGLICGNIGPLDTRKRIKIPIWLGLILEKEEFCLLKNPSWFNLDWLEKKINKEKKNLALQSVPFNYLELSSIFISRKKEKIKFLLIKNSLIEELYAIRFTKIWSGMKKLQGKITAIKFDKIGSIELDSFKEILQAFLFLYFFT